MRFCTEHITKSNIITKDSIIQGDSLYIKSSQPKDEGKPSINIYFNRNRYFFLTNTFRHKEIPNSREPFLTECNNTVGYTKAHYSEIHFPLVKLGNHSDWYKEDTILIELKSIQDLDSLIIAKKKPKENNWTDDEIHNSTEDYESQQSLYKLILKCNLSGSYEKSISSLTDEKITYYPFKIIQNYNVVNYPYLTIISFSLVEFRRGLMLRIDGFSTESSEELQTAIRNKLENKRG
jgi:hypothetical protein